MVFFLAVLLWSSVCEASSKEGESSLSHVPDVFKPVIGQQSGESSLEPQAVQNSQPLVSQNSSQNRPNLPDSSYTPSHLSSYSGTQNPPVIEEKKRALVLPHPHPRPKGERFFELRDQKKDAEDRYRYDRRSSLSYDEKSQLERNLRLLEKEAREEDAVTQAEETDEILNYTYELLLTRGLQTQTESIDTQADYEKIYKDVIISVHGQLQRAGFSKDNQALKILFDIVRKIPLVMATQKFNIAHFLFSKLDADWQKKYEEGYRIPFPSDQELKHLAHNESTFTMGHWKLMLISLADDIQYRAKDRQSCLDTFYKTTNNALKRYGDFRQSQKRKGSENDTVTATLFHQTRELLREIQGASDKENPIGAILALIKSSMSPEAQSFLQGVHSTYQQDERFSETVGHQEENHRKWKNVNQGPKNFDTQIFKTPDAQGKNSAAQQKQAAKKKEGDSFKGLGSQLGDKAAQDLNKALGGALQNLIGNLGKALGG